MESELGGLVLFLNELVQVDAVGVVVEPADLQFGVTNSTENQVRYWIS